MLISCIKTKVAIKYLKIFFGRKSVGAERVKNIFYGFTPRYKIRFQDFTYEHAGGSHLYAGLRS